MNDSLRGPASVILACLTIAATLIWAGRQLGYPIPWVSVFPMECGLWLAWCQHDRHRTTVARALVEMGIEKGYLP